MKVTDIITTARQFIRGVCALPQVAAAASELRTWLSDDMVRGLASERNEQRDRIADLEWQLEYLKANHNDWMHEREVFASERAKAADLERQLAEE